LKRLCAWATTVGETAGWGGGGGEGGKQPAHDSDDAGDN
jgi:hypothetical protein